MMKYAFPVILFCSALATAQVPRGQGYVVQGLGIATPGSDSVGQTMIGGEHAIYKGLGLGAEIGAVYPFQCGYCTIGAFSPGASYHFLAGRKDTKWDPFVNAGYTLFFRSGVASGIHYGGGVAYWFHPRLAVRAEFRDIRDSTGELGFPSFRIGLSFR